MSRFSRIRLWHYVAALAVLGLWYTCPILTRAAQARADQPARPLLDDDDAKQDPMNAPPKGSKDKKEVKGDKKTKDAAKGPKIRWGQRRGETDADYDKRYAKLVKRIKQDKRNDYGGGIFVNATQEIRMWTYMGHPFIVRTDIDQKFTADLAMYMEMLHREYGIAYKKLLGKPADVKEKIEVIVFADRDTYVRNGGSPSSGGFFHPAVHFLNDRGDFWPARHYRLVQFTDGITNFAKWEKGTLKHEAAHMELQLRLGYTLFRGVQIGFPVDCPRWWNEGHATVFEYWDFEKTVDENFADIPNRGRYAPVIRRIYGTDKWKEFSYVWEIDPQTWHGDMTSEQGFLNYAQSWSLAAYMMNEGVNGRGDFRRIFDLSKRVGVDEKQINFAERKIEGKKAWKEQFPDEEQQRLEDHWSKWVSTNVSHDKAVPDEDYFLKRMGYKPEVVDRLERYSQEEFEKLKDWIEKEKERRKKATTVER